MQEIHMEKTNESGNRQMYQYFIEGNTVKYKWGVIDGKIQTEERVFTEGKNIGKKNEKSQEQCCLEDTVTRARKKHEKGYEVIKGMDIIEANTGKAVKASNLDVPKPMKANTFKDHLKKVEQLEAVFVQSKLDGNRCIANTTTGEMFSSSRKPITHLPNISEAIVKACKPIASTIQWVDGELYSPKLVFNDLQTALRRHKNIEKEGTKELQDEVKLYIFDVVTDDGFRKRLDCLNKIVMNDKIEVVDTQVIHPDDIDSVNISLVNKGYEGVMIRLDVDTPYQQKRSMQIFKHKLFVDEEYAVIGFESQQHNDTKLGSVTLIHSNGEMFNARPAVSDTFKAEIWNNKDRYIGRMATVKFQEKDAKSDIPRFPVLTKFRLAEDISP